MTKDLQIGIPSPCSENWGEMSPEANGRFCSSCQKTVLDFTLMDDKEILQWLANYQGSACGRFRPDQLNRPIANPPAKKNRWRYWQYLVAGLLFSSGVSAQTRPGTPPVSHQNSPDMENDRMLGKIKAIDDPKLSIDSIRGRVMDTNGHPVMYATIKYNKAHGVVSDGNGYFAIPANRVAERDTLFITAVGYKAVSIPVAQWNQTGQIQLIAIPMEEIIAGGISVVTVRGKRKPLADTIAIFKDTLAAIGVTKKALTIYPNPATRGNAITIAANLEQAGTYTIQLFNISGTLLQTTEVNDAPKNTHIFNQHSRQPDAGHLYRPAFPSRANQMLYAGDLRIIIPTFGIQ